jgi:hypothetical protein
MQEINHAIQNAKTKTEVFQTFMRNLMLRFTSLVELIKQVHPKLLKEMSPPHIILLDLKNAS